MSPKSTDDGVVFLFLAFFYILGDIQEEKGGNLESLHASKVTAAFMDEFPQAPCLEGPCTWFHALLSPS